MKDKTGEAFEQIRQYEQDIPRLFFANVFNIVTDGALVLYGATGSGSKYYAEWRDPWPKREADFPDPLAKGLWCLLEPGRLLDLIAHYVVFEKTETGTIKKICRYQQFRAVKRSSSVEHCSSVIRPKDLGCLRPHSHAFQTPWG